jgi:hypothetical protein
MKVIRRVSRYQRGNQNPYIEEEHNGQKKTYKIEIIWFLSLNNSRFGDFVDRIYPTEGLYGVHSFPVVD